MLFRVTTAESSWVRFDAVQGNFIGTDLTGTIAMPNLNIGVNVSSDR